MANIEGHLQYLKDSERFPKINRQKITNPRNQFSGTEYNRIVDVLEQSGNAAMDAQEKSGIALDIVTDAKKDAEIAANSFKEVKESLKNLTDPSNPDASLTAQVALNKAEIAELKETMEQDRRRPNVAIEFSDEGDIILVTGEKSLVRGAEMNEDGEISLNIQII